MMQQGFNNSERRAEERHKLELKNDELETKEREQRIAQRAAEHQKDMARR